MSQGMRRARGILAATFLSGLLGCATHPDLGIDSRDERRVEVRVDGGTLIDAGGATWIGGQDPQPPAAPPMPPPEAPQAPDRGQEELPFLKFGPNILVDAKTGRISKLYYVPSGLGETIGAMMKADPNQPQGLLRRVVGSHEVIAELIPNLDSYMPGAIAYGTPMQKVLQLTDALLVSSTPEGLEAFERAFNFLFTGSPQIDIAIRIVETSFAETLDIGIKPDGTSPTLKRLGANPERMFINQFTANFPNETGLGQAATLTSEGLFSIGGIHDDWQLKAILEVLQSQTSADIVSQPRIAVRNGAVAQISTVSMVPYPEAKISGTNIATNIKFEKVGVTLKIRPAIMGTDTILLQLDVQVSAVTSYENTDPVRTPVISTRTAQTDVLVRNGQSVAIGGLLTQTEIEIERKVPVLGDIPVVGLLFRSTNKENRKSEVIFFVTPRIMQRGGTESFEQLIPLSGLGG